MGDHQLEISASRFRELREHLFQGDREEVAFLFADQINDEDDGLHLRATEMYSVPPGELDFQSAYHVSLTDDGLAKVIKMAWDRSAVPVEVHSHRAAEFEAGFSASDFWGFEETVPHVRWRLQGAPYLALVFTPNGFDGLVWVGEENRVEPLDRLVVGEESRRPTGKSYRRLTSDGR